MNCVNIFLSSNVIQIAAKRGRSKQGELQNYIFSAKFTGDC